MPRQYNKKVLTFIILMYIFQLVTDHGGIRCTLTRHTTYKIFRFDRLRLECRCHGYFLVQTGILRLNAIDQGMAITFNLLDNWRDGDA